MSLWGNTSNDSTNSIMVATLNVNKTPNATNRDALFQNTTVNAWATDSESNIAMAIGQWGVTPTAMSDGKANTSSDAGKVTHAGWQLRRAGVGPVSSFTISGDGPFANLTPIYFANTTETLGTGSITTDDNGAYSSVEWEDNVFATGLYENADGLTLSSISNGVISVTSADGTGYSNSDYIIISNGVVNAYANIETDDDGVINTITVSSAGQGFASNDDVVVNVMANSTTVSSGSDATLTVEVATTTDDMTYTINLGGRAGRVTYETLATAHLTGAGSELFPNT